MLAASMLIARRWASFAGMARRLPAAKPNLLAGGQYVEVVGGSAANAGRATSAAPRTSCGLG
jgi:hypothetical protein